ncbi:MAG TPA: MarR family transcriptional regulator [Dermatophilaceae bacterium]|nr:MarR family transcriptional regulator [Dermatophilaceae bacterium]
MDATDELLVACRRFIQATDLSEERVAARLGIGRSDLRAVNLLEHGPVSHAQIARQLGLTPASVTALIDRLQAHGLVQRTPHPTDRRVTHVELLPRAWSELAAVYRPIGSAVLDATSSRPREQRRQLATLLHHLADVFDQQPT